MYACTLAGASGANLAAKEFRLTRGADGAAEDELKILAYVDGPSMPKPVATYTQSSGQAAVVLQRFDPSMVAVGGVPNFNTITRDAQILLDFPDGASVTALLAIARALRYLHEHGICHGDVRRRSRVRRNVLSIGDSE